MYNSSPQGAYIFATKLLPNSPLIKVKFFVRDKQCQLDVKTGLCEKAKVDEKDITNSSRYIVLGLDKTITRYIWSLPEDCIKLEFITQYLDFVNNYEGS